MTRASNRLDDYTADTLRKMVRYIADDHRIARHLAIDVSYVRAARRRTPIGRRVGAASC